MQEIHNIITTNPGLCHEYEMIGPLNLVNDVFST